MSKTALALGLFLILINGCGANPKEGATAHVQEPLYVDENTLVLFALDAQSHHKSAEAVGYYDLLYKKTEDNIYRDEALKALMQGRYYNDVVTRLDTRLQESKQLDSRETTFLIVALIAKKEYARAEKEALELIEKEPTEKHYLLLTEVYVTQKDYLKALATLEKAYAIDYSEPILDKIAVILYTNIGSPYEAIGRIEQHCENFGYSLPLTQRLVAFYSDQRNEEGLLKTYPHLYKLDPSEKNASVLIQLYYNANRKLELVRFLEESGSNDELLLKFYIGEKAHVKAIPLADKLYKKTGELDYLGQKAIFMYEVAPQKKSAPLVSEVIDDLTKVVAVKEEGHYLNYLGYCMIENDRNITQGIGYVKRALILEPDSGYFIDSLAWGYYKEGNCTEAKRLMQRVVELLGPDDLEVKAHVKAIDSCLKKEEKE